MAADVAVCLLVHGCSIVSYVWMLRLLAHAQYCALNVTTAMQSPIEGPAMPR